MATIVTVGVINMTNKAGERTGCFDVCRSDETVHLRINRMGSEVVTVISKDAARSIAELLLKAAGGFCLQGDQCVCGGDTPEIQAQCHNWIK